MRPTLKRLNFIELPMSPDELLKIVQNLIIKKKEAQKQNKYHVNDSYYFLEEALRALNESNNENTIQQQPIYQNLIKIIRTTDDLSTTIENAKNN